MELRRVKINSLIVDFVFVQVKWWTTFNEPLEIVHGYADCRYAPYLSLECFDADYIVGHNILKAHAAVYRVYREKFFDEQKGTNQLGLRSTFFIVSVGLRLRIRCRRRI